jgi:DNA ligase-1
MEQIEEVDAYVRQHITGRRGPVRLVQPELVFELAFDGVHESRRHKCGLALRYPRLARWRRDKQAAEADHLETLRGYSRARLTRMISSSLRAKTLLSAKAG